MNEPTEIEFKVDEQYENEKGIFKVISIDRNEMVIRWENGEEIITDIDLQRRIAERRQWEKRKRLAAIEAANDGLRKAVPTVKKTAFDGFAQTDFKNSAAGTSWRSRHQLGTLITTGLKSHGVTFNSWAFRTKPEMHVQDVQHRGCTALEYQAKFFVRVDPMALYFGLLAARPAHNSPPSPDWNAFLDWLGRSENEEGLRQMCASHHLTVYNRATPIVGLLTASQDGWHVDAKERQPDTETLSTYIDRTPVSEPFDFEIAARLDKSEAFADGRNVVEKMVQLFTEMLPLYQAVAQR